MTLAVLFETGVVRKLVYNVKDCSLRGPRSARAETQDRLFEQFRASCLTSPNLQLSQF